MKKVSLAVLMLLLADMSSLAVELLAAAPVAAAPKAVFAEEPKGDERYFTEITQLLPYRDGALGLGPGLRFMKYDSETADNFPVAGVEYVTSMDKAGEVVLFLGMGAAGDFVLVAEEPGKEIRAIPLPREVREQRPVEPKGPVFPQLLASSGLKALTVEQTAWWLDGENWKNRTLPKVPKFHGEFEPEELGGMRYLLGDTLFVGWDQGEWGGMLVSINLKDEKAQWIHLSGKKKGDSTGIPENQPVQKILSTDGKTLWVATGLAHLSGTWSGLSRRGADGRWSNLINTEIDEVSGPLSLPCDVSLSTMAAHAKGEVYLLGQGAGIFRVEEKALAQVLDHPFMHSFKSDDSAIMGCYPLDMAIGKQGDIFVSTSAFGILAFHKEGQVWKGRQILVKGE